MLKHLRIVMLWLLTLAIPLQGFAAATMLFCAAQPHHHEAAALHAHGTGPGMHDGRNDYVHGGQAASPSTPDHQDSSVHAKAGKCNNCAACCAAAALPVSVIEFKPVPATSDFVAHERHVCVAFLTEGPERPPRAFLA